MILVQLNKDDYAYDIHSLVKAFYPSENVSVCTVLKDSEDPVRLRMQVDYLTNQIRLALCEPEPITDVFAVNGSDRIGTKNLLKQHIYKLLSEHTGKTLPWGTLTGIRPTKIAMNLLEEGKTEADVAQYMEKTYGTSAQKIALSLEIAQRERSLLQRLDYEKGYSLYIGIPFCPSTCLYCSFTSFPLSQWGKRVDEYLDALEQEIAFTADRFSDKHLDCIYIGGGTPTTLSPRQMDRLLTMLERSLDLSQLLEFTVEAGRPDSIDREKLEVLRAHGISRISINPQTMKQETLDLIGRRHTVEQTADSFYLARSMGFTNINMDLIMGLFQETLADVKNTLAKVKELAPDSVTVHSLAVKRAARLQMFKEDYAGLTMVNTQEHLDAAEQACAQMGMAPYYLYRQKNMAGNFENVGYAKEGKAGIYNVLMMEEKQSIVACGAGSISKRLYPDGRIVRCENVKDVTLYLAKINEMIERKRKLFTDLPE
ncbi:MAG: coproporphyrinogen dehydrogenase HemZ [Eubacterium sp.]|nr:coproporphyrinogen dehydrogenase HemZ [Eubacterium sp.]